MSWLVPGAVGLAAIYCAVQAIRDFRNGNYVWASAAAVVCILILVLVPVRSSYVNFEKPVDQPNQR